MKFRRVEDPTLLKELLGETEPVAPEAAPAPKKTLKFKKVTDPALLQELGVAGQQAPPKAAPTPPLQLEIPGSKPQGELDLPLPPKPRQPQTNTPPLVETKPYAPPAKPKTTLSDVTTELSKATAKGAVETAGSVLKGIARLTTDDPERVISIIEGSHRIKDMSPEEYQDYLSQPGWAMNPIAAIKLQKAIVDVRAGKYAKITDSPAYAEFQKNQNLGPIAEQQFYKAGEKVAKLVAGDGFKPRKGWENGVTVKIGQGLGSSLVFIPSGIFGPAGVMLAGGLANADSVAEEAEAAIQKVRRDDRGGLYNNGLGTEASGKVRDATMGAAVVGTSESIPVETLLTRTASLVPGLRTVANTPAFRKFSQAVGKLALQAGVEGGQEGSTQVLNNVIQKLTLDPEKEWNEGLLEAVLVGAAVGGITEAPVTAYEALKPEKAPQTGAGASGQPQPAGPPKGLPSPKPAPEKAAPKQKDISKVDGKTAMDMLTKAGYSPADILSMTPEQLRAHVQDLADADPAFENIDIQKPEGVAPPQPGGAPRARRTDKPKVVRTQEEAQATGTDGANTPASFPDAENTAGTEPPPGFRKVDPAEVFGDGSRGRKVDVQDVEDLNFARKPAEPTEAQKEAGNYQKRHVKLHGLDITIENDKGSIRRGKDADGAPWEVEMPADYGYIKRTTGADGDQIDVTIAGKKPFVIEQNDPETGKFDEHKVIFADNAEHAQDIYEQSFSDGKGLQRMGSIEEHTPESLKSWLDNPQTPTKGESVKEGTAVPHSAPSTPVNEKAKGDYAKIPKAVLKEAREENEGVDVTPDNWEQLVEERGSIAIPDGRTSMSDHRFIGGISRDERKAVGTVVKRGQIITPRDPDAASYLVDEVESGNKDVEGRLIVRRIDPKSNKPVRRGQEEYPHFFVKNGKLYEDGMQEVVRYDVDGDPLPDEPAKPPKREPKSRNQDDYPKALAENLRAARDGKDLPHDDLIDHMIDRKMIALRKKDGKYVLVAAGRKQLETEESNERERKAIEKRLAEYPDDLEELKKLYVEHLDGYHNGIVNSDKAAAKKHGAAMDDILLKANGGTQFGIATNESPAEAIREHARAPNGTVPKWGQRGRWIMRHKNITAIIDNDGGTSVHAVYFNEPFTSSTGYHSVTHFDTEQGVWGTTWEDEGKRTIEASIRYSTDNKHNQYAKGLTYPETVYELPPGKGEGINKKRGVKFDPKKPPAGVKADELAKAWKELEEDSYTSKKPKWRSRIHPNGMIVGVKDGKLVPNTGDFPTEGSYIVVYPHYQGAEYHFVKDAAALDEDEAPPTAGPSAPGSSGVEAQEAGDPALPQGTGPNAPAKGGLRPKPATPQVPPMAGMAPLGAKQWKPIGKNAEGEELFEDERGVRSKVRDGVRVTEPVTIRPTRGGVQIGVDHKPEFTPVDLKGNDPFDGLTQQDRIKVTLKEAIEQDGTTYGPVLEGSYLTQAKMHFVHVKGVGNDPLGQGKVVGPIEASQVVSVEVTKSKDDILDELHGKKRGEAFDMKLEETRDGYEAWLRAIAREINKSGDNHRRKQQLLQQMNDVADKIGLAKKKRNWIIAEEEYRTRPGAKEFPARVDLNPSGHDAVQKLQRPKASDFDPDPAKRAERLAYGDDPLDPRNLILELRRQGFGARLSIENPDGDPNHSVILIIMPGGKQNGRFTARGEKDGKNWVWSIGAYEANQSKAAHARMRKAMQSPDYTRLQQIFVKPAAKVDAEPSKPAAEERQPVPLADLGRELKYEDLKGGEHVVVEVGAPRNPHALWAERRRAQVWDTADDHIQLKADGEFYTVKRIDRSSYHFYEDRNPPKADAKTDENYAEIIPEAEAAEAPTVESLKEQLVIFSSGMSRVKDMIAGSFAWGGSKGKGIGVDVGELSQKGIEVIAERIVNIKVQMFIDSGAFSMFRANQREKARIENVIGEQPDFKSLDFDEVMGRYDAIAEKIGQVNEAEEEYPAPLIVMPDVVGDQAASFELARKYKKDIVSWAETNIAKPIVPIQKGKESLAEAYHKIVAILGTDQFIVGIPSNKLAVSDAELTEFIKDAKPRGIHFLGSANEKRLEPRLEAIAAAGHPLEHLSADGNILRGALYGRSRHDMDRSDAIVDTLTEKNLREFQNDAFGPVVAAFRHRLGSPDGGFDTIVQARKFAEEHGFERSEDVDNKRLEEDIELAVVLAARDIIAASEERGPEVTYQRLVDLYNRQPKLSTRTSKSMAEQAYSTPAPVAYIASRILGLSTAKGTILEPTAGNGMLLLEVNPFKQDTLTNEIDSKRRIALEGQGFKPKKIDAATTELYNDLEAGHVIANPPFGAAMDSDGATREWDLPNRLRTTRIDYAISMFSLEKLAKDGQAILILGGPSRMAAHSTKGQQEFYDGRSQREFYFKLYKEFNVVDHFTVAGELYERQGAGWPIDVIVINGRVPGESKSERRLPSLEPPKVYSTFEELGAKLNDTLAPRTSSGTTGDPSSRGEAAGSTSGPDEGSPQPDGGRRPDTGTGTGRSKARGGLRQRPAKGEPVGEGSDPAASGEQQFEPEAGPDSGRTDRPAAPKRSSPRVEKETTFQRRYEPSSQQASGDTLVPANMQTATAEALERLGEDVDAFVAKELGYKPEELSKHFLAEQIDAIALAIDQYKTGGAVIVGDQTGIGKGRVMAAMIRYAIRNKMAPIFLTEKPDLYGDMFRDMNAVGLPAMLKRDVRIFATNAGATIPLDDDAIDWKAEKDEYEKRKQAAKEAGREFTEEAPPRTGTFLRTGGKETVLRQMHKRAATGVPEGYDVIFTTYDQTNTVKGEDTPRRGFLKAVIPNAFLILDEAHNAGGSKTEGSWASKDAPENRSEFIRGLVEKAKGVVYSSATYAKRPDVMDLYSRTDMRLAVEDIDDLAEIVTEGGVPMQQAVAAGLAEAGQYIRRERSFDGIKYELAEVEVDQEAYASFTDSLRAIMQFDLALKGDFAEAVDDLLMDRIREIGGDIARDAGTGDMGVSSTNFASVMHNLIGQMILALKAEGTVKEAIAAMQANEKPVIALANTNESFIDDYAEAHDIGVGDDIDITFKDMLRRYLTRTLRITITDADRNKTHIQLKIEDLPPEAQRMYQIASDAIEASVVHNLPVSPIDYLRDRLTKAGIKVAEITGRKRIIDYSGNVPVLRNRDSSETGAGGKRVTIKKFNDGRLDAVIFNRSGSTGVSMHASKDFKDQRKRRMLLQQAEGNIDTHFQTLGRVNRTGQVVKPDYRQIAANVPAEKRPAAILLKKMASLNANTTASRKGAMQDESVTDFMNQYGDMVAASLMEDRPDLHANMAWPLPEEDSGGLKRENAAARVTARLTLLKPKEQEELLEMLETQYTAMIAQLDAMGENALEAKTLDLQAEEIEAIELSIRDGESTFQDAVVARKMSVKAQGKSMSALDVVREVGEALQVTGITEENKLEKFRSEITTKAIRQQHLFLDERVARGNGFLEEEVARIKDPDAKANQRKKLGDNINRWRAIAQFGVGMRVRVTGASVEFNGVVLSIERGKGAENPLALSQWSLKVAMPDGARMLQVPFSQLYPEGFDRGPEQKGYSLARPNEQIDATLNAFDVARVEGKEKRWIVTGPMLKAGAVLKKMGQLMVFTKAEGGTQVGMLMARAWDPGKQMAERSVTLVTPEHVLDYVDQSNKRGIESKDGFVEIANAGGLYHVMIAASKKIGGRYFLHPAVRKATGDQLTKAGKWMRYQTTSRFHALGVVKSLMEAKAKFTTEVEQDLAESIVKGTPKPAQQGAMGRANPKLNPTPRVPRERLERVTRKQEWQQSAAKARFDRIFAEIDGEAFRLLGKHIGLRVNQTDDTNEDFIAHYEAVGRVITMSLDGIERMGYRNISVLRHEAFHAIRNMNVLEKHEWALLTSMARKKWMAQYMGKGREQYYRERYANIDATPEQIDELILEEAVAYAFQDFTDKLDSGIPEVDTIFRKLWRFLMRVRNLFIGRGFQTSEDVFNSIFAGDMAMRREFSEKPWSEPLYLKEDNQAPAEQGVKQGVKQGVVMPKPRQPQPRSFQESEDEWRVHLQNQALGIFDRADRAIQAAILPLRRGLQDRMIDWMRVEEAIEDTGSAPIEESMRVYRTESLYPGRVAERVEEFRKLVVAKLTEEMVQRRVPRRVLDLYLYARHAPERNAYIASIDPQTPDGGSGMTNAEAAIHMQDFHNAGILGDLQALAAHVDGITSGTLRLMLREGLIDQQAYNQWTSRWQYYVPLRGWDVDPLAEELGHLKTGRRYDLRGKEFQAALGRTTKADSPLAYTLAQAETGFIRSEKARVDRTIYRLVRKFPNKNLWEINQVARRKVLSKRTGLVITVPDNRKRQLAENVLAVKVGGNQYWITIHHEGLLRGVKGMSGDGMGGILRLLLTVQRYLAVTRTGADPQFFIPNFIRDLTTAGIHITAEQGTAILAETLKNVRKAMGGMWKFQRNDFSTQWAAYAREFAMQGGKVGGFGLEDIEAVKHRIDRDMWLAGDSYTAMYARGVRNLWDALLAVNGSIENSLRLSLYIAMRNAGHSKDRAAAAAREVTVNFNRKGEWGRYLSSMYLFANAGIQGTTRVAQMLYKSKLVRRVAVGLIISGAIMDTLNSMLAGDDDDDEENDYDQLIREKPFEAERAVIIAWPGTNAYSKIPLPWVYNVFYYTGVQISQSIRGKIQPLEAAANIAGALAQAANPLNSATFLQMLAPTWIDPMLDIETNKDWKGDKIMPTRLPGQERNPDSQLHYPNVNPTAKGTADFLNSLTGGDEVEKGFIDVSPETIEYMVEFVTGGIGQTINQIWTVAQKVAAGDEIDPERVPFVRKIFGRKMPYSSRETYYEISNTVDDTTQRIENATLDGDRAKANEIREKHSAALKVAPLVIETDKRLKKLWAERRKVKSDPSIDPQRKHDAVRRIEEEIDRSMTIVRKAYREAGGLDQ